MNWNFQNVTSLISFILLGYGGTAEPYHGDRSKFILAVIQSELLSGSRPVLISPSMSGEYSVKFVAEHADMLSGYIPVAPVSTSSVPQTVLQSVKVQVCWYWLLGRVRWGRMIPNCRSFWVRKWRSATFNFLRTTFCCIITEILSLATSHSTVKCSNIELSFRLILNHYLTFFYRGTFLCSG
jgi:hypothetical protein